MPKPRNAESLYRSADSYVQDLRDYATELEGDLEGAKGRISELEELVEDLRGKIGELSGSKGSDE